MSFHTLYLCYFGLREPLVQTQVLPYLREIKKLGDAKISLLTFETRPRETWTAQQIADEKKARAAEGIEWDFLTYHKTPSAPATIYDVLNGAFFVWKKIRREPVDILHARVHVPAMMGAIARRFVRRRKRPQLLFDIRGFFPEEYTDAGRWKADGFLYKAVKRAEKWLLKDADAFVVLTEKARQILFSESLETGFDRLGRPVEVIPCCVNLSKFDAADPDARRAAVRLKLGVENRTVAAYVGSFGGWYLTEETLDFLATARENDASIFALILTQREPEKIAAELEARGFTADDYLVKSVAPTEIPNYLSAADIALSFIKRCYSKQASSPTKIAEYLAGGLPVVSNRGIGDLDEMIETDGIGALIGDFSRAGYLESLRKVNDLREARDRLAEACRTTAHRRFDLEAVGGEKYRDLYRRILRRKK